MNPALPTLKTDNPDIDRAFALALSDLMSNVAPFRDGLLDAPAPVILAGGGYDTPWTRDAAINVWNGAGLILPEASRNTLLSVLTEGDGRVRVGGQYWDAIIWVIGAWHYWLYTGDASFLELAREVTVNSLAWFEATEFDPAVGLFRGPACYGDGVSAYPDRYADRDSGILYFVEAFPEKRVKPGYGIPLFSLSTNCLYYEAYRLAHRMTGERAYAERAEALKAAVNRRFWNERTGLYDYCFDAEGRCERQEALGLSFALMFGIADEAKRASILTRMTVTPQGVPCVYPGFERYLPYGYGRHSGTVWPHAQAFWADASSDAKALEHELKCLTRNALASGQFAEIYHPVTGEPYGGAQENFGRMEPHWVSQPRQTWSATGYLRMILMGLAGLRFGEEGLEVRPRAISSVNRLCLTGLTWRGRPLSVEINDCSRHTFVPVGTERIVL